MWAATETASALAQSRSMRPKACTASTCASAPPACAASTILAVGWMTPVSLFAAITLTRAHESPMALTTSSALTTPSRPDLARTTSKPRPRRMLATSSTESCSIAERTTRLRLLALLRRAPSAMPSTARLFDSVPPLVRMTSLGLKPQPMQRASMR